MADRQDGPPAGMRVDKWLWAARFFKTRGLAAEAAEGGHVKLNGRPVKPSRDVRPGDRLEVMAHGVTWEVDVLGINAQRRPAAEARLLYRETAESAARRQAEQETRRLSPEPAGGRQGRPTKRDRREISDWKARYG